VAASIALSSLDEVLVDVTAASVGRVVVDSGQLPLGVPRLEMMVGTSMFAVSL